MDGRLSGGKSPYGVDARPYMLIELNIAACFGEPSSRRGGMMFEEGWRPHGFCVRRKSVIQQLCAVGLASALVAGCSMVRLAKDIREMGGSGIVAGAVVSPQDSGEGLAVVLFRREESGFEPVAVDRLSSVIRTFVFVLEASVDHRIVAFHDLDGDSVHDPGEPVGSLRIPEEVFFVEPQQHVVGQRIELSGTGSPGFPVDLRDVPADTDPSAISLIAGDIKTLDDEIFSVEQAREGMWVPGGTALKVGAGVYFLEPFDADKIPVLFVHGIGGSPLDFQHIIARLDRDTFQPWVFHYPSGIRLHGASGILDHVVAGLRREHGFQHLFVVAHSMGGLVARSFALEAATGDYGKDVDLLLTLSTPWNGHAAAAKGVKYSPAVVPSWIDIQPDSDFLKSLREPLPSSVPFYLLFGYHTGGFKPLMPFSHDTVVSLRSQLAPFAQDGAIERWGYDLDHAEILEDTKVLERLAAILKKAAETL